MSDHYTYYVDEPMEHKEISPRGCKFLLILFIIIELIFVVPMGIVLISLLLKGSL